MRKTNYIKSSILSLMAGAMISLSAADSSNAREMRFSSFEPAQAFLTKDLVQAWIDKVNPKLSKANQFKLYPGGILGSPPAQQELVKSGVADAALVIPNYSPGVFPLTSVVQVPFLAKTSHQGTAILQGLLEQGILDEEYKDFKLIALFTTKDYHAYMHEKEIRVPADFKGLRLRTPSPYVNQLVESLGATGVRVPGPQVYEALERGVADGTVWVFNAYKSFRLAEVAPKITKIGMTSIPLALLMNKNTYNALPAEDKKIIDEASNRAMSEWMANVMDAYEKEQEQVARDNPKITFTDLSDSELQLWKSAFKDAPTMWVERQQKFKVDAKSVLEKAQTLSEAENN